jgi:hypothetical protein
MKNSHNPATAQADAETSPGAAFRVSREFSAETETDLPSVSGEVAPLAPQGATPERELDDGGPDRAGGSAIESEDKLPAQAVESPRSQPFAIAELFGRPRLLSYEDLDAYNRWEQTVLAAVQPRDLFEAIWARDFSHFTWEIERGRRLRAALLEGATPEAIRAMVKVRIDDGWVDQRAHDAKAAELASLIWKGQVSLDGFNLREDEVAAQAYRQLHSVIDSLERQIAGWETRRNKLLQDLETRREKLEIQARFKELLEQAQNVAEAHWAAPLGRQALPPGAVPIELDGPRHPKDGCSRAAADRPRGKSDSVERQAAGPASVRRAKQRRRSSRDES